MAKSTRTTIHGDDKSSGVLHVDYDPSHNMMFMHLGSGGFTHCLSITPSEARLMAEALMKGAFAIEEATPNQAPEAA